MGDLPVEATCTVCNIHFGSPETLKKHMTTIHPTSGASELKEKRPRTEPEPAAEPAPMSENVELEPLLAVLSEEQKDALLLRAVQRDPDYFYERILEQATTPLSDEAADARLNSLDSEAVAAAVRWFCTIGAPGNALSLLVAASQRCLAALEAADERSTTGAASSSTAAVDGEAGDDGNDGLQLAAVERLPAAGLIGALWAELLGKKAVLALVGEAEAKDLRLLFEGLQSAAASVRAFAPAVLVGPGGETAERLADALARLDSGELVSPNKKRKSA